MTKLAFVFPGQGSQYVGMGQSVAEKYPAAAEIFARADDILHPDLSALCGAGDEETLNHTYHPPPDIFVHSIAVLQHQQPDRLSLQP